MPRKYEKIILWTATEVFGKSDSKTSALDYIGDALTKCEQDTVLILDSAAEEYELTTVPPDRTLANCLADAIGNGKWVKREQE
tara:strand:- start:4037 stop:4285 length:249 start_codon:yes stop_codon:yes gene_type:complete